MLRRVLRRAVDVSAIAAASGRRTLSSWRRGGGSVAGPSGETVLYGLIGANAVVFAAWHAVDTSFMLHHFTVSFPNLEDGRVHTLITHAFSHMSMLHMGTNLVALYFFGGALTRIMLGKQVRTGPSSPDCSSPDCVVAESVPDRRRLFGGGRSAVEGQDSRTGLPDVGLANPFARSLPEAAAERHAIAGGQRRCECRRLALLLHLPEGDDLSVLRHSHPRLSPRRPLRAARLLQSQDPGHPPLCRGRCSADSPSRRRITCPTQDTLAAWQWVYSTFYV